MLLDLGSGAHPRDGYTPVDLQADGAEHVDLEVHPWPWADGSVDAIWCSHLVEHIRDLIAFMNDAHRVLRPGGAIEIVHPYQHSNQAWQDPTHVRALNEDSWSYYDAAWRAANGVDHYPITADLAVEQVEFALQPEWDTRRRAGILTGRPVDIAKAVRNGVNVVAELHVTLRKP